MSAPGHQDDHVRRIVLPSGKTIEVVCFGKADDLVAEEIARSAEEPATEAPRVEQPTTEGLHICPDCASKLVYPYEWEESSKDAWEVARRCPNCHWEHRGVFAQELLEEFDEELDRGLEELAGDLKRFVRANMADEIDRFVVALQADAIFPMDF